MTRTPEEALEWAENHRSWPVGYCLKYVRTAYGVPAKHPSAIAAWNASTRKHGSAHTPPRGAPVFWRGGNYGHVAISAGKGLCWSTDAIQAGRVDLVRIEDISRDWNYQYLGWTNDLNGVVVWERPDLDLSWLKAAAQHDTGKVRGLHPAMVRKVQKAMGMKVQSGRWARGTRRKWKRLYPASDGYPTRYTVSHFAKKHGFTYGD